MEHRKYLVVYNPIAGRKKAEKIAKKYLSQNDKSYKFRLISGESSDETRANLRSNLRESNAVIAIGGDGLVNLVLQEIVGGSKPLFVHAAGTGNDFHRHNFNKIRFVKERFETKFIDLAKCSIDGGERLFGQALSAGFDSLVNRRANELRYLPGALKYVIALFLVLPRFRAVEYKLIIDGKDRNLKAMMVVVANGPTYGGGMKVLPFAKSDDGELDVLILHPVSKFTLIKVFPKVFIGQHIKHPKVEILKCKTIKIVADVPIYADGEYFGNGEVNIEILPSILPIIGSSWN